MNQSDLEKVPERINLSKCLRTFVMTLPRSDHEKNRSIDRKYKKLEHFIADIPKEKLV